MRSQGQIQEDEFPVVTNWLEVGTRREKTKGKMFIKVNCQGPPTARCSSSSLWSFPTWEREESQQRHKIERHLHLILCIHSIIVLDPRPDSVLLFAWPSSSRQGSSVEWLAPEASVMGDISSVCRYRALPSSLWCTSAAVHVARVRQRALEMAEGQF